MTESLFSRITTKPGMVARLKIGSPAKTPSPVAGLSASERNLSDIIQLSGDARSRIAEGRKLDAYLRVFSSALKMFSGFGGSHYKPVASTIEIELVEAKNPYKVDTHA